MGQLMCLKLRCFHRYSPTCSLSSQKGHPAFHLHQVKETCLTRRESNSYTTRGCRRPSFGEAMDYFVLTQHCSNKYLSWYSLGMAAPKQLPAPVEALNRSESSFVSKDRSFRTSAELGKMEHAGLRQCSAPRRKQKTILPHKVLTQQLTIMQL